jgi:hypothetical protein
MSSLTRDILDLLEARASSGRDAFRISENTFTKIITVLQRDPRFAGITRFELELMLINQCREFEEILFNEMRDRIHLDDAEDAVCLCLGEDE